MLCDSSGRSGRLNQLEDGIEPEIVTAPMAELRRDKEAAPYALAEMGTPEIESEDDYLAGRLARIPNLTRP